MLRLVRRALSGGAGRRGNVEVYMGWDMGIVMD